MIEYHMSIKRIIMKCLNMRECFMVYKIKNQTMKMQYNNHLKYMNLNKNQKVVTPK